MTTLSPREHQLLELIADGHTAAEIGRAAYLAPGTVHSYLQRAYGHLGASGAANAVHLAHRAGLLGTAPVVPTLPGRPGPNDVLPCGTDSARRRHLAHGRDCTVCGVPDGD